jgi:O-antigen/teichoic acid export membrane protein
LPDLLKRQRFEFRLLRPLLRIGAWVTVKNLLWPVIVFLDRFTVGAVLSLAAVSYFSTPVDLVNRLGVVPGAVAAAVLPALATSHRTRPDRVHRLLRAGSLAIIVVTLPACLLLAGLSGELLTLWLGASFAANSAQVLGILAVGIFLYSVSVLPGTLTDAIGRPEAGATIMLGATILSLPMIILMCTHYGVTGAALAWTLRSVFCFAPRLLICGRLNASVAPVISKLVTISLAGSTGLIACTLTGPLRARMAIIGLTLISVIPIAIVILIRKEERTQLWETARRFCFGPAVTRTIRGA